ncbi:MAG: hypothetical protein WCG25_09980 [bacterium]
MPPIHQFKTKFHQGLTFVFQAVKSKSFHVETPFTQTFISAVLPFGLFNSSQ